MKLKHLFIGWLSLVLLLSSQGFAQDNTAFDDLFSDEPEFLDVDEAFAFDFIQNNDELVIKFDVAEGYYLYKKQFKTSLKNVQLGEPIYPEALQVEDEFFGISDVFRERLEFTYPVISSIQDGVVKLRYQGCADAGLCYPPTTKIIYLSEVAQRENTKNEGDLFDFKSLLNSDKSLLIILGVFVLAGLGLSFTPCVFPMYPILSSIVLGQSKQINPTKAFTLSFIYVQGMAITYALLGLVVAYVGVKAQAFLQHPVILSTFIVLFIIFAVGMFGAFELQLPSKWQEKLNSISNQQKGGSKKGVFLMGVISALVASPCITLPFAVILGWIAQTGDLVIGFSSLYTLSIGMGIPLIIFAVTGGSLLPKAGNWMNVVKTFFGFMMLSVALMFVERMIVAAWTVYLWSLLGLALFSYFFVINQDSKLSFWKGVRAFIIFLGLLTSALYSYPTLMAQITGSHAQVYQDAEINHHPEFVLVKDLEDFQQKLSDANAQGKNVMVDLYADWCVACKEFEKFTFPDADVQKALTNTVQMQIDLTDNTDTNIAFQEQFSVLGLPTILFFDTNGNELSQARVTGFMKAEPFANHIQRVLPQ